MSVAVISGINALVLSVGIIASLGSAELPAGDDASAVPSLALVPLRSNPGATARGRQVPASPVPAVGRERGDADQVPPFPPLPSPTTPADAQSSRPGAPGPGRGAATPAQEPRPPQIPPTPPLAGDSQPQYQTLFEDSPVQWLLNEIARQGGMQTLISPRVSGNITGEFKWGTIPELFSSILTRAGLVEKVLFGIHFVHSANDPDDRAEMAKKLWITSSGDRVVTRGETKLMDLARTVVDKGSKFRVYNIRKIEWPNQVVVEIESDNVRGFVAIDQIISLSRAIDYFTDQVHQSQAPPQTYAARGNIWYELGEYEIATSDYDQANKLNPSDAIVLNNRGYCWWKRKAYDKALADYNESIRLDPGFAVAFNNRSLLWATSSDPKYRDVYRAVTTARVWQSDIVVDSELLNALAITSALSKERNKIVASVAAMPQNDATKRFLRLVGLYYPALFVAFSALL